jgi:predicted nucleic acid-binding protein
MIFLMHKKIVINTGPILALVAGFGNLDVLKNLYDEVYVTKEVANELLVGGVDRFASEEFAEATFLIRNETPIFITPMLRNMLDIGEASVIQFALDKQIPLVCIDESAGRRVARLNELKLTGSIGIVLKAKSEGFLQEVKPVLDRMVKQGIFISPGVISTALKEANE